MSNIRCYMEEEKLQFNIFYKTVNWVSSKKFHTTNSFSQNVTFVFTKKGTYLPIQNNVKQNFLQHCLRTKLLKMFQSVFYLLKIAIHNVMKTNKNCWFFFILPRSINYNTKEFECSLRSEMNYMDSTLFKCFAWIDGLVFIKNYICTSEFSTKHLYIFEKYAAITQLYFNVIKTSFPLAKITHILQPGSFFDTRNTSGS